jgi:hypothetical protein
MLHCSREQWMHAPLFSEQCSMLHCSVNNVAWFSVFIRAKQLLAAFFSLRFKRKNTVGSMNSELCFFLCQIGCICVLNKTQTQPHYQTASQEGKKKEKTALYESQTICIYVHIRFLTHFRLYF